MDQGNFLFKLLAPDRLTSCWIWVWVSWYGYHDLFPILKIQFILSNFRWWWDPHQQPQLLQRPTLSVELSLQLQSPHLPWRPRAASVWPQINWGQLSKCKLALLVASNPLQPPTKFNYSLHRVPHVSQWRLIRTWETVPLWLSVSQFDLWTEKKCLGIKSRSILDLALFYFCDE